MASAVKAHGECRLYIFDDRQKPYLGFQETLPVEVNGKTAEELICVIWERFNITQKGDRELIQHGLSSSMRYDTLDFITSDKTMSFQIVTSIPNRNELFFPRRAATLQEGVDPHFHIRVVNVDHEKKILYNRRDYRVADLDGSRESLPEVVALYQSESFFCHVQRKRHSYDLNRTFTKIS